ncbi:hypothetical protein [Cyanobium gracile]|uniref:Uncharacterized protein n=1 Tax=Cyanobium gracile (strain ATCC 27147 / PCC 6307) TaxID=292564 RepID=K9PBV4_CYAGP|nr:hypothetical protein [Cyanobium gracile]AFY30423.1 hypothetical protein Cyagr_3354 [Cyanobium gracile PCC 6307]
MSGYCKVRFRCASSGVATAGLVLPADRLRGASYSSLSRYFPAGAFARIRSPWLDVSPPFDEAAEALRFCFPENGPWPSAG